MMLLVLVAVHSLSALVGVVLVVGFVYLMGVFGDN